MPERQSTAPALTKANPVRGMARESDVLAPLLQSIVWGGLVTLVLESGAFAIMHAGAGVRPWLMLYLGIIAFPLVSLVAWAKSQGVARATLWAYETAKNEDLDGDHVIGKPGAHPFPVGSNPQSPRQTEDHWHAMAEGFIHACFKSGKTGERAHVGHRFNGERLTQAQYDELRGILLAGRWARVRPGIRGGWEFRPELTAEEIIAGLQEYREER